MVNAKLTNDLKAHESEPARCGLDAQRQPNTRRLPAERSEAAGVLYGR